MKSHNDFESGDRIVRDPRRDRCARAASVLGFVVVELQPALDAARRDEQQFLGERIGRDVQPVAGEDEIYNLTVTVTRP